MICNLNKDKILRHVISANTCSWLFQYLPNAFEHLDPFEAQVSESNRSCAQLCCAGWKRKQIKVNLIWMRAFLKLRDDYIFLPFISNRFGRFMLTNDYQRLPLGDDQLVEKHHRFILLVDWHGRKRRITRKERLGVCSQTTRLSRRIEGLENRHHDVRIASGPTWNEVDRLSWLLISSKIRGWHTWCWEMATKTIEKR